MFSKSPSKTDFTSKKIKKFKRKFKKVLKKKNYFEKWNTENYEINDYDQKTSRTFMNESEDTKNLMPTENCEIFIKGYWNHLCVS